jgi:hypothetical protein
MKKLSPEQIERIRNIKKYRGAFIDMARELGVSRDYVKQLWHQFHPKRPPECDCGQPGVKHYSTGWACAGCLEKQAIWERWQQQHPLDRRKAPENAVEMPLNQT